MSKNNLLEQIEVKNPCSEDWDEMTGNDEVRFCSHCNLNVNNLSAMTRRKALKIVRRSKGRICVRYVRNPVNKTPVFADRLYQIRRAGLAAGILGASLSLSSLTYAQGEPVLLKRAANPQTEISQADAPENKDKTEKASAKISGTVMDAGGAFAPNVIVTLFNLKTNESRMANSDAEGFYEFGDLAAGIFKLVIAGERGNAEVNYLEIAEGSDNRQDLSLIPTILAEVTVLAPEESIETVLSGAMSVIITYDNPLSLAVLNDDVEEVRNLIAAGADVNGREDDGKITPLFLSVENGNAEIAEILLNFGAKVNARDEDKQTPLMRLDDDASAELVMLLIKHGAKVNLTDNEGNSALILAAENAGAEILQILIDNGADVNAKNKEGQTALLNAAYDDDLEKVKVLIQAGADVNVKNEEGESVLNLAADEEVIEFLLSQGAIGGETGEKSEDNENRL